MAKRRCGRRTEVIHVVNEPPPHTTPYYANSIGGGTNGDWRWITNAFQWARQACPDAVLVLNDYNIVEKADENQHFIDMVKTIQGAGAPIDAIGAQAINAADVATDTVKALLEKLNADTGLPIYITGYRVSRKDDAEQLRIYQSQLPMFLQGAGRVTSFWRLPVALPFGRHLTTAERNSRGVRSLTQETFMQAIVQDRYGSADVLQLREIARPQIGADDVLIRVHAAGVDFGVWHLMAGLPYAVRLVVGVRKPRNPVRGTELAGVVDAVGANVTALKVGDEVFGVSEGSFAEYARASPARVINKPYNLTFEQAAVVPVSATTALVGLRAAKVEAGQKVLVIGAGGGVGCYAVQLARSMGAEVTGVCSTAKLEFVRSLGATHVIDYTREDFADGGRRYDAIIDLAGSRTVSHLRRALAPTGTLVILGGESGGRWLGMGRQLWSKILGLVSRQRFRSPLGLVNQKDLGILKALFEAGTVMPIINQSYPLREVPTAVRALAEGHSRGKFVIKVC